MTTAGTSSEARSTLEALVARLQAEAGGPGRRPPVEQWRPTQVSAAGLEIRRDGSWWHEGARMTRETLVRLFASVLRKDEDGRTYLVTPVEKVVIEVEDAPFLAIRADRDGEGEGQSIVLTTNMGDVIMLGAEHGLRVETDAVTQEPRPYAHVRGRLEARILRAPFMELVSWADERDGVLSLWSAGACFRLGPAA